MSQRLALGIIPGVGWRAREIQTISQQAEGAGFQAIFATEVNNDVLATVQLMGAATQSIRVGSWVANIYLRHPYLCAKHAALIADATDGRMVLGLGISHRPVNSAIGVGIDFTSRGFARLCDRCSQLAQGRRTYNASAATSVGPSCAGSSWRSDLAHCRACGRVGGWLDAVPMVPRAGSTKQGMGCKGTR